VNSTESFQFHPVCLAFPEMGEEGYQRRLKDYRRHPERAGDTAVLLAQDEADGEWKIADGRHHYLLCRELGYEAKFQKFTGDPAELVDLVKARNINRRHQSESQIAAAIAALETWERGGDRGNQHTVGKTARAVLPTQEYTARAAGISADTLQRAGKVAEKAPELLSAIRDGKLDAKTAAKVADLPEHAREKVAASSDPKQTAQEVIRTTRPVPTKKPRTAKIPKSRQEAFDFKAFDAAFGAVARGPDALKAAFPNMHANDHADLVKFVRSFRRLWEACVERVTRHRSES
jgi:hypothetical protein